MGRPKKETYKIDERYIEEALLLAGRYSESVKRRDQLRNLITGNFEYTKDMAIRDLIGGGVRYDTERVQTSNISNQPERIAILLDNDFVWKERRRIQEEARKYKMELDILNRELAVIEVAMKERMDARTRAVFRCLYIEHLPWSRVKDEFSNHLKPQQISKARNAAIRAIAEEIMSLYYCTVEDGKDGTSKEK